ncbi:hypothetical protein EHI8A_076130 [Entamoeba histolytica HM-1:IMSS-B]|uniref:Uncharacterized protein n=6 Tax=Entamoeba histolytica TaxID=5759 RepID=C4M5H8_ENTH1|nr:hypothetical protein, conserved [Entamoeba histolytica HM-1:IMSS]EMD42373.1 Hypothetical protein EHI5A_108350 [Entamoeba histolytica KU27]EMH76671.1 hypothetical protein EHI8A_076130 [Entamoeba histolytica HM-1:IMSS-B]EMS15533.1 hypothetical protein KM1_135220 [Entamoeba histolytica HM-3:IMSS]ENY63884.1 hypothetical protein EHI7A_074210 [Entamoeba histolytica HM-1:IMSS-A]GAT96677.1 hypothetical protein conserved [Entamoeba histolytica]|eukprot:XP_654399.1 hypothetical protein, conserved [Entamoeba histolytica HM-1:IMSS]
MQNNLKSYFPIMKRSFYAFRIEGEIKLFGNNIETGINGLKEYYITQFKGYPFTEWFWMIEFQDKYFGFQTIFTMKKAYSLSIRKYVQIGNQILEIIDLTENKKISFNQMAKKYIQFVIENNIRYEINTTLKQSKLVQIEQTIKEKQNKVRSKKSLKKEEQIAQIEEKEKQIDKEKFVTEQSITEIKANELTQTKDDQSELITETLEENLSPTIIEEKGKIDDNIILSEIEQKTEETQFSVINSGIEYKSVISPIKRKSLLSEVENPLLVKERERKERIKLIEQEVIEELRKVEEEKIVCEKKRKKKETKKTKTIKLKKVINDEEVTEKRKRVKKSDDIIKWNINEDEVQKFKEEVISTINNNKCLIVVCNEREQEIKEALCKYVIEPEYVVVYQNVMEINQNEENKKLRIICNPSGLNNMLYSQLQKGIKFHSSDESLPLGTIIILNQKQLSAIYGIIAINNFIQINGEKCISKDNDPVSFLIQFEEIKNVDKCSSDDFLDLSESI